jgi:hypothetical protein
MYDWYLEYFKKEKPENKLWPIVLDADDVMSNPELVRHYATLVGMDPSKLKFSWPVTSKTDSMGLPEPGALLVSKLYTTIDKSTGIVGGKTWDGVDLATKALAWKEEFGEEEGKKIEKLVREAMPDYEFMLSRKLTL